MRKTLATLAVASLTALTMTQAPASASDDRPTRCGAPTTTTVGEFELESNLCHFGRNGRLRVAKIYGKTVDEVNALRSRTLDSTRLVQPAVVCGNDGDAYLLELAGVHPADTGVKRISRFERTHFDAWAERYIEQHPYGTPEACVLTGPL